MKKLLLTCVLCLIDRINKSGTIKCGYVSYAPASLKDAATGKISGYTVDIIEQAATRMGLTVDWAYETNWPTMATDLQTNKFDLACVTYWSNPRSGRQMRGTDPIFYQPVFFATRADDARFDKDISKINDESVTIAVLEGDVPETIIRELYPRAKTFTLPQTSSFAQVFQEVASRRADVTITSKPDMNAFATANPSILKLIIDQPVRLYPTVMQMLPEATQLQNLLNTALLEMNLDGTIENILQKYSTSPHDYYIVGHPYTQIKKMEKTQP